MGAFAYVVPLAPDNDFIIICVDMVLPMGWVDSPKFFCAFSEILTDVANAPVETDLPVPAYGSITKTPSTRPAPPHTCERLTHIDCYTDDTISAVKGGPERQHQVFDGTVSALKWIFRSKPGESKDLASVKKLLPGEGDWNCVKEVLGRTIDKEAGTVALPEQKLRELLTLVDIMPTQRRMGPKDIEGLLWKLRYMHLAVTGAVAHIYHIQRVLAQGGVDQA